MIVKTGVKCSEISIISERDYCARMDISGSLSSGNNSLNIRPLFAGYPFQGTAETIAAATDAPIQI